MAYLNPSLQSLISSAQTDLASQLGYTPFYDSNENIFAMVNSMQIDGAYQFLYNCFQQTTPFTAGGSYLEAWSSFFGISRKTASYATGNIVFTGNVGAIIPLGSLLTSAYGQQYVTQTDFVIGLSSSVQVIAINSGPQSNLPPNTQLNLNVPITNVNSNVIANAITGGSAIELDDALRNRMLQKAAQPGTSGTVSDYVGYALACSGVTRAWVIGSYTGAGSVNIFVMKDISNPFSGGYLIGTDGVATSELRANPATGDQLLVANQIYAQRNVSALVYVQSPKQTIIQVTIAGLGLSNSYSVFVGWTSPPTTLETNIKLSVDALFTRTGTCYGGVVQVSDIYDAIKSAGAANFTITYPVTATPTPIGNLPQLYFLNFTP